MSLMPSLCAALERVGGERLVMRAGERPHVLAGERRHDVASAVLSINAVEALAEQILSTAGLDELAANGTVSEVVQSPSFPHPLVARAERVGEDFCVELIVSLAEHADPPAASHRLDADTASQTPSPELASDVELPSDASAQRQLADQDPQVVAIEPETQVTMADVTVITRVQEPVRPLQSSSSDSLDLWDWIGHAAALGATTLYLRSSSPVAARINDRIQRISSDPVPSAVIEAAHASFSRGGDGYWESRPDGEWVREDEDHGYVSCRPFSDLEGPGLVVQLQPSSALRLLYKHIPRQIRTACEGNGLVVVAASSEAEVEALASAVADWSGRERGGYLISLQRRTRPRGDLSGAFVSQRSLGGSESDFAAAIRRAAQESPDILLVTGIDTDQSLQSAVMAAAGGRLVILGLIAMTTLDALRRLGGSDRDARRTLAASFRGAIGYRNVRRLGGGRILIRDVVLANSEVCGLLEHGDFDGLRRTLRTGLPGMRSVDESLARAVTRRQIGLRDAARHAVDSRTLVALVRQPGRTGTSGLSNSRRGHGDDDHGAVGAVSGMLGSSRF